MVSADGQIFDGATQAPGGPHAERVALSAAGERARGATVYTTLEPCDHTGRTGPCSDALVTAGVARVVAGVLDPDPNVAGQGLRTLEQAGIEVETGVGADAVEAQLAPYLHQRRTGRPFVVLKVAMSLDGRTAAPDGSSQWITGPEARAVGHRIRAESDAVIVGAGTVRADDPSLTVRDWRPADDVAIGDSLDPMRVVLGTAPAEARVRPCVELAGPPADILRELRDRDVLQVMIEGGAGVAGAFHRAGLVDRYELFLAPALFGGDDAMGAFAGPGAANMADVMRGRLVQAARVGADLHVTMVPDRHRDAPDHR